MHDYFPAHPMPKLHICESFALLLWRKCTFPMVLQLYNLNRRIGIVPRLRPVYKNLQTPGMAASKARTPLNEQRHP